jgi:hypothetical protein
MVTIYHSGHQPDFINQGNNRIGNDCSQVMPDEYK